MMRRRLSRRLSGTPRRTAARARSGRQGRGWRRMRAGTSMPPGQRRLRRAERRPGLRRVSRQARPDGEGNPVVDWFMPFNFADLNNNDTDLGASGPMLMPGTDVVADGQQRGRHLCRQAHDMGHFHKADDNEILQNFPGGNGHIHGAPVVWLTPKGERMIYVWSENDNLKTYQVAGRQIRAGCDRPVATALWDAGRLSVALRRRQQAGTGIIWASRPLNANANWNTVPGLLQAFDASDPTKELWNSHQNAARDDAGCSPSSARPLSPTARCTSRRSRRQIVVYGLLPKTAAASAKVDLCRKDHETRLYPDRTARRHRHHRGARGDLVSCLRESAREGAPDVLRVEREADRSRQCFNMSRTMMRRCRVILRLLPVDSDLTGADYKWMDAVYPYVKNEQVFDCPSDRKVCPIITGRARTMAVMV